MFKAHPLDASPVVRGSLRELPLKVLLVFSGRRLWFTPGFNLPRVIAHLLGPHTDEPERIIGTSIWSDFWDEDDVRSLFTVPIADPASNTQRTYETERVEDVPGFGRLSRPRAYPYPRYDIFHFAGHVETSFSGDPVIRAFRGFPIHAGALRDALVAARTRLLILECQRDPSFFDDPFEFSAAERSFEAAERFAKYIVSSGGPAVLCVSSNLDVVGEYFTNLYANIVHNYPLSEAAKPADRIAQGVYSVLYMSTGGENSLRFDGILEDLDRRLRDLTQTAAITEPPQMAQFVNSRWKRWAPYFRKSPSVSTTPKRLLTNGIASATNLLKDLPTKADAESRRISELRSRPWHHEYEGLVPLARAVDAVRSFDEATTRFHELVGEFEAALAVQSQAEPRVLNANFVDPASHMVLKPHDGLLAGREYDFLIDIGPRWDRTTSLVIGNEEFPEQALPSDGNGHVIEVALMSEQLRPHTARAFIWLPNQSGRSCPYVNGVSRGKAGPVALRVQAREFPQGFNERVLNVTARLCLYFEGNLLQSATVRFGVILEPGVALERPNEVDVDFVLSGTFRELERLATRTVAFEPGQSAAYPIAMNIALNDDGAGSHRIVIKSHHEQPPGWFSYDPKASEKILGRSRDELGACYWQHGPDGVVKDWKGNPRVSVRASDNGKTREQFEWDLFRLAQLGGSLRNQLFTRINPQDTSQWSAEWSESFGKLLVEPSVIQIARMRETPANYVFPWALVYEYPVPDEPKFCRIVEEQWTEDGLRAEPYASSLGCCPHANEPDHDKSLCPFGFWGLAHIVEQPISPITKMTDEDPARDVGRKLHSRTPLSLSVAATQDASLNSKTLTQHIKDIGLIPKISILMPVANDWTKVGQILANPELVYILCHGEYDKVQGTPYLGIGPRDDLELHKIFPDKLINLLRTMGTAAIWKETGPIIFINGCHTTNLSPGDIFDFVSPFAAIGATGVIGTEISVDLNVAVEFATSLMTHLAQGHSVCEAIRFVRWSLVNKGNLLGLAYTPYCLADLAVSFDR